MASPWLQAFIDAYAAAGGPMLDLSASYGRLSARDEAGSVQDEEAPPAEPVRDPGDADQPSQKYCDMSENQICTGVPCAVS